MNHVENCVEDHVKYFKVCWKPYWKFQGLGRTAEKGMTWPFENIFHRTNTVKIKTDIMDKDNGMLWSCMCSLIEILWVLKEKISLNCWQL